MEETRGCGWVLRVKGVGDGTWKEEDEPSNDNQKEKKSICILIWEQREV